MSSTIGSAPSTRSLTAMVSVGAHCHIVFIGTGLGQHTTIVQHIGSDGVTAGIVRQVDFDVTEHTAVVARLVFRATATKRLGS